MGNKSNNDTNLAIASQALIAEYGALRREIELLIEHQKEIMNFSILTFVAMAGLFGIVFETDILSKNEGISQVFPYIYLVFPSIFLLLALLYADKTVRILRAAAYLHSDLRERISRICEDTEVWRWELYKSDKDSFKVTLASRLDWMRWLIFILPSIISIGIFLILNNDVIDHIDTKIVIIIILSLYAIIIAYIIWLIPQLQETTPFKDEKSVSKIVAENVASIVAEHHDKLPSNVGSLLSEFAENDETADAVAIAVAKHFDKLPEDVRNELLLKLVKKKP